MVRYRFLAFGFFMAVITYLDRVCISAAAPDMRRHLGVSGIQTGLARRPQRAA